MFEAFFKDKLAPLALRLGLGSVYIFHGYLKIMAAGGTAWKPGLPTGWQLLIAWGEFACGLAILIGFRCRASAAVVLALTVGTLVWWQGWQLLNQPLRNLEPIVLLSFAGLALLFLGAGGFSIDGRNGPKGLAGKVFKRR